MGMGQEEEEVMTTTTMEVKGTSLVSCLLKVYGGIEHVLGLTTPHLCVPLSWASFYSKPLVIVYYF
jgi:hypothetical protein